MECSLCGKDCCNHASQTMNNGVFTCNMCGEECPENYCLPFYEGQVDFASECFGTVCRQCCDKYLPCNSGCNSE